MSKLNKPRLGRGLSSLISVDLPESAPLQPPTFAGETLRDVPAGSSNAQSADGPTTDTNAVLEVPVNIVRANPHQPRREFPDDSLRELAASLKTNGLIQPIVVRKVEGGFELIAGERRLRAAKLAGLNTISVVVKEVDGLSQAQLALVENIQREDLNPLDRALAYKTLLQQLGLSHSELAVRLGEDRSTISNHLRLLELPVSTHSLIQNGVLSLGHAKVLGGVSDVLEQERLAKLVVEQELSVRNLERLIQNASPIPKSSTRVMQGDAHIKQLEHSLSHQLGMKVSVKSGQKGKGKVVIAYASLDEFDDLLEKLGITPPQE